MCVGGCACVNICEDTCVDGRVCGCACVNVCMNM